MLYPTMTALPMERISVEAFGGYNHNPRIPDGDAFEMRNLCADAFPLLSVRHGRGTAAHGDRLNGLIAKDHLCYVDGSRFVVNGYPVEMGLSDCPKQLVSMGAYVIILPDRKFINTAHLEDWGCIDARFVSETPVTFSLCTLTGDELHLDVRSETAPENPAAGEVWLDVSASPNVLRQWNAALEQWQEIAASYVRIAAPGIGAAFRELDAVSLSGVKAFPQLEALEGSCVLWGAGEDSVIVAGLIDEVVTVDSPVTLERRMPDMDFVIESGNRLWGCRYGVRPDGQTVNEIYASRLGDFRNWNAFLGTAADSYAVSVGSDGQFTGAVTFLGYPMFFKENCVHKIFGSFPANFQVQTTALRGVQRGSDRSLAIVNECLYYKSRSGICRFDGALPEDISRAFGVANYFDAVGGGHAGKYYVSMRGEDGLWALFVYDTRRQLWHREDETRAEAWCSAGNELYFIADGCIRTVLGSGEPETEPVQWLFETGVLGLEDNAHKHLQRLELRLRMDKGSRLTVQAEYDSSGVWDTLCCIESLRLSTQVLPLLPKRCDHLRLRLRGVGSSAIYGITRCVTRTEG